MSHHLSASKLKLGKLCAWWARPDVALPPRESSKYAELGTALHEAAEEHGEIDPDELRLALLHGDPKPELEQLFATWRDWWAEYSSRDGDAEGWRFEVPFAFDLVTGRARELPSKGQRDYSAAIATEIPGTLDAVLVAHGEGIVLDLKTGFGPHRVQDHIDQLTYGAICLQRLHGLSVVRIVSAWVKPDEVVPTELVFDAFDLDIAAAELQARYRGKLETASPAPGLHCARCPAAAVCPETRKALAEVVPDPVRLRMLSGPIEGNEHARILALGLPMLDAWVKERAAALKEYSLRSPVDLGDGKVYGAREHAGRESFKMDHAAAKVVRERLGDEGAEVALELDTSKAAIERGVRRTLALRGITKRGAMGALRDEVLEDLRKAGALKRGSPHTRFEVFERKGEGS